jgi:hypothetical protein
MSQMRGYQLKCEDQSGEKFRFDWAPRELAEFSGMEVTRCS